MTTISKKDFPGRSGLLWILLFGAVACAWGWWEADRDAAIARAELRERRIEVFSLTEKLIHSRTIQRVIDGDTVVLDGGEHVRILGINTPELSKKIKGRWEKIKRPDPRAVAARDWLRGHEGARVRMSFDKSRRDRYGRTLANLYILPGGPDVAEYMLKQGWAEVMAIPPNTRRYSDWQAARDEGREKRKSKKGKGKEIRPPPD